MASSPFRHSLMLHKFAVIVGETNKSLHFGAGHRTGPGPDGLDLAGIHGHATSRCQVGAEIMRPTEDWPSSKSHLLALAKSRGWQIVASRIQKWRRSCSRVREKISRDIIISSVTVDIGP